MISWGLLSAATALVTGPTSFFVVRVLIGVAEAGLFPGCCCISIAGFRRTIAGG